MPRKGKLETEMTNQLVKLEREVVGRGPQDARAYIVDDMVIIRLKGVLTIEEKNLAQTEIGRQAVKQIRQILRETYARDKEKIVSDLTGCRVIGSHGDISTKTAEQVEVFILDKNLEQLLDG
ncbi:MAG: DUF2294 domain-containing protein [Firmicutes bacterium]|nr:DUF2294 domain-containing protein [Bacillota bacterium]